MVIGLVTAPAIAHAQESGDESDQSIVVTATRTARAVNEVPISIAVMTQQQMDDMGIKQFADIARLTPGVQLNDSSSSGRNNIAIRGVASSAGAATTGIYIDDVPIQVRQVGYASGTGFPVIFDLERVEILRGPQGTLFGAGSEGGTIRFIQVEPSTTEYSGYARAEGSLTRASEGSYEGGVAFGGPIVEDKIGFRVSAYYRRDGGWYDKVPAELAILDATGVSRGDAVGFTQTGEGEKNINWQKTYALRAALKLQPAEDFSITPSVFYQDRKTGSGQYGFWLSGSDADDGRFVYPDFTAAAANPAAGIASMTLPDTEEGKSNMLVAAVNSEWDVGDVSLYLTTSYLEQNKDQLYDYTTGYEIGYMGQAFARDGARGASIYSDKQKVWTSEFRIQSSKPDSFIDWVAGVFYSRSKQKSYQYIEVNTMLYDKNYFGIGNLDDAAPFGPGYSTFDNIWGAPMIGESGTYLANASTKESQIAGFAQVDIHPIEKLTLTFGARWSRNELTYRLDSSGPENNLNAPYGAACPTGPYCPYGEGVFAPDYPSGGVSGTERAFTPKIGASYELDRNNMIYASASKGYRNGGGQIPLPTACDEGLIQIGYVDENGNPTIPSSYGSDSVWSYEIGSKNRLFGGAVNFDGAGYIIKWDNMQSNVSVPICGYAFTDNLNSATVKGVEFTLDVMPTEGLNLTANVGYQHTSFNDSKASIAQAGPPWKVVLSADYRREVTPGVLGYARVDYSYTDKIIGSSSDTLVLAALEDSELVNARIGARFNSVDVSLFANNLLDAAPLINPSRSRYIWQASTFRPRTIGITASYRY
ncbi:hypothetical protein B2G71_08530 [Novosphingobium sp. PC22D]|nr:hypothetical protein B2G71_08530 [Novosphingobium sp. PC22D]